MTRPTLAPVGPKQGQKSPFSDDFGSVSVGLGKCRGTAGDTVRNGGATNGWRTHVQDWQPRCLRH